MEALRIIAGSANIAAMWVGLLAALVVGSVAHRALNRKRADEELKRLQDAEWQRSKAIEHRP